MVSLAALSALGLLLLVARVWCAEDKSYSVELNSFERNSMFENDAKWVDWGSLRVKKVGRNKFALTGEFEMKLNLGDEQKLSLQVFTYDAANKKKGPMVMNVNKPFCQFISEDEDTYPHLQAASNLPEKGECPFPKGEYSIDNYELETTFLPDDAPKADYLIELNILDKEIPVAGLISAVTLT
ncbi:CheA7a [Drosophila busckii]|uniref:CheA7a n=1 Tax=Drosophila busckii TaxID=30019 RepID=A0A0M5JDZ2_DROBS|nr:uncharacterized protein LOC108606052 [Drosophila busckii]ALC49794.1 CheA7a [Drosophila busckii]